VTTALSSILVSRLEKAAISAARRPNVGACMTP
jgi:hypothetical protein